MMRAQFLRKPIALCLGSVILYIGLFFPSYALFWRSAIALSIVPIIVFARYYGMWGGISAGLGIIPVNILLYFIVGETALSDLLGSNFIAAHLVFVIIGFVVGYINIINKRLIRELEERTHLEKQLHQLAITDSLTNLYNRRHLYEMGQREIERYRRYGRFLAAIMLDLDHFKKVNDTYGHAVGDEVLQKVAEALIENTRDIDIVSRYGGEEFVVLMPETNQVEAYQAAERLRKYIEAVVIPYQDNYISVTVSLGVAVATQNIPDLAALIESADQALYQAKGAGRNCVRTAWGEEQ